MAAPGTALELAGGQYPIDFGRALAGAAPGQTAYAIQDRGVGRALMAVQAQAGLPVRARALGALLPSAVPGVLCPIAHGPASLPNGEQAYFVVCDAPAGRPLSALGQSWQEHDLIECVLRPVAAALEVLAARNVTHRAIRADNLFQAAPGEPVVLGCAWAQPSAFGQPALYEPPYVSACLPTGRGEGCSADDVYALGALLVVLALGVDPMAGLSPEAVTRRKLDLGSYAAIVGERRLPSAIAELARGMLADDPEHRPSPALLGNPAAARARRIAARPPRRAQRPMEFEGQAIWNTRVLGHVLGRSPQSGAALVRSGAVGQWLRRSIGDAPLAARVEEAERSKPGNNGSDPREDALMLVRTIAILNPLAPLYWPGAAFWPDGIGAALAHGHVAAPGQAAAVEDAIKADAPSAWAAARPERCNAVVIRTEARRWRTVLTGPQGSFSSLRLSYGLNPVIHCASPMLAGHAVTRPAELLGVLEAVPPARRTAGPVDPHIAAFLAGRRDDRSCAEISEPASLPSIDSNPFAQLRLLARLQATLHPAPLPSLAAWLADTIVPALTCFHSKARRLRLETQLRQQAATGNLAAMVICLDETAEQFNDRAGWSAARSRMREIDDALIELAANDSVRGAAARGVSAEISGGAGLLAACVSITLGALG